MLLGGRSGVLEQAMHYSQCCSPRDLDLAGEYAGLGDTRYRRHADSVATADRTALVQIVVGGALGPAVRPAEIGMRGVAAGQLAAFTLGAMFLTWYLVSGRSRLMLNFKGFTYPAPTCFSTF